MFCTLGIMDNFTTSNLKIQCASADAQTDLLQKKVTLGPLRRTLLSTRVI